MIFKHGGISVEINYSKLEVSFTDNHQSKVIYFNNKYSINKFLDGLV